MNQLTTRFIITVTPTMETGVQQYAWKVQYAPAAGYGPRQEVSGRAARRKQAIAEAIMQAGELSAPERGAA